MARPTATHDALPVETRQLPSLYSLRDEAEVAAYLRDRPGTLNALAEIANMVPEYFPGRPVALNVLHDPEEPLVTLCVLIQAGRDVPDARARLDRFDHEWWFDSAVEMDPDICVDVEYR